MNAHLFLNLANRHRVARAKAAISVHQKLRHDEQRDALGALAPARRFGQHQMDDILGHIVIASRDENLGAGDLVAAIRLRLRLGPHQAQIGAAMRFGQVHRAGPVATDHLGQIHRLLLGRTVRVDRRIGAMG